MNKKILPKILVPIGILIIIAGIWLYKNWDNTQKGLSKEETRLEEETLDLKELESYDRPMLLDFGAEGCGPCEAMMPDLKAVNHKYKGKVTIKFFDVWENPNIIGDFPVEMIPIQFFFDKDGKPFVPKDPKKLDLEIYKDKKSGEHIYTRHIGALTKEKMEAIFKEMGVEL